MRNIISFIFKYHIDHILSLIIIIFYIGSKVIYIIKHTDFIKNILYNIIQVILWGIIGYFRQIWFGLCFVTTFYYCKTHDFSSITLLPITGKSLILCLFIFLVIYPFISNFKIPGVEGQFYDIFQAETASKKIDQYIEKMKITPCKNENPEVAKLSEELNNVVLSNNNDRGNRV